MVSEVNLTSEMKKKQQRVTISDYNILFSPVE